MINEYRSARQVVWLLIRSDLPSLAPWYRVVNAKAKISMSISRNGSDFLQRDLLMADGIPLGNNFKVAIKKYRWKPEIIFPVR